MMMWVCCVFYVLNVALAAPASRDVTNLMLDKITSNGYVAETHYVTTEDGYILGVYRIPYARYQTSGNDTRPLVFCMHGLYGQSQNYIIMEPELALGFNLADAGFDVWFGNARGNVHSRSHVILDPEEEPAEFFDFTWEEIGLYDLPAMIDYILEQTGREKLHYIGHSQGGTVFLVMGSMRPEYNEKMESVHLLAGVGYQEYFPNEDLLPIASFSDIIYALATSMGLYEVTPALIEDILEGGLGGEVTRADLCFGDIKYRHMCELIGFKHFMRDTSGDNETSLGGYGGGSIKQIAHYGQNIRDKLFRRYHHGTIRNLALYGSTNPPLYDLSLITSHVVMHYTLNDNLLDERDVIAMAADMPNTVVRKVGRDSFLHSDFVVADDAKELVTDFVIESIYNVHYGITEEEGEEDDITGDLSEEERGEEEADQTTTYPEPAPDGAAHLSSHLHFIPLLVVLYTISNVLSGE